jgi:hypothetical protein
MPDATASDSLLPHSKGSVLTASATPAAKGKRLDIVSFFARPHSYRRMNI